MRRFFPGLILQPRRCGQYLTHILYDGSNTKTAGVHHLVAAAFLGPRPLGLVICHNDGNGAHNTPDNLRYDTPKANAADTLRHGKHPDNKGERHGNARFTEEDVIEMRRAVRAGATQQSVADTYSTGQGTVSAIVNRKAWRHV